MAARNGAAPSAGTTWSAIPTPRSWSCTGRCTASMSKGPGFRPTLRRSPSLSESDQHFLRRHAMAW
jgi:hypothetical protein